MSKFNELFGKKPVIGMIHATGNRSTPGLLQDVLEYQKAGVNGIVIKDWYRSGHGVMIDTLDEIKQNKPIVPIGINILENEYQMAFIYANMFNLDFVQARYVAGRYESRTKEAEEIDPDELSALRKSNPELVLLGGAWPKDHHPVRGSRFKDAVYDAKDKSDAVVISGNLYSPDTKIEKIIQAKEVAGDTPVLAGSRVGMHNIEDLLISSDGVMIGRYVKHKEDPSNAVDPYKLKDFMQMYNELASGYQLVK